MPNTEAITKFKTGVRLLRNGYPSDAIECFRVAADSEKDNPYYLSFLGVSLARSRKNLAAATDLCEAALRIKRDEPQLYLNLSEVYLLTGSRQEAIEILDAALMRFGPNARLKHERSSLGKRTGTVLPFLSRQHFLNRTLGQIRHRAFRRRAQNAAAKSRAL